MANGKIKFLWAVLELLLPMQPKPRISRTSRWILLLKAIICIQTELFFLLKFFTTCSFVDLPAQKPVVYLSLWKIKMSETIKYLKDKSVLHHRSWHMWCELGMGMGTTVVYVICDTLENGQWPSPVRWKASVCEKPTKKGQLSMVDIRT